MLRLKRILLRKLVSPLTRNRKPPEYTARGAAVGLMVAFTPTIGVQMPLVSLIWIALRYLRPEWSFNLLAGLAWTWVTNIFTLAPTYYLFLVTGRILMGRWDRLAGFETFRAKLEANLAMDAGPVEGLWIYMVTLFEQFGLPMWIGSMPWALLSAWLGYHWSLRLVIKIRSRRALRSNS